MFQAAKWLANLDISRAAIGNISLGRKDRRICNYLLPKKGYKIEKFPEDTCRIPDLIALYYRDALPFEIILLDKTASTNNYAKSLVLGGKKNNFLVVAEEQTGGRGRFDRKWVSAGGKDLTFSFSLSLGRPALGIL